MAVSKNHLAANEREERELKRKEKIKRKMGAQPPAAAFQVVGGAGIEPATSCVSSMRSSHLS